MTYDKTSGVWSVGTVNSGSNKELSITARVAATGTIANTARISHSDQLDSTSANNADSSTINSLTGEYADLEISQSWGRLY
jgi:hypothetical protein